MLTSAELNETIEKMCDESSRFWFMPLGGFGKTVPYIGWFWREVDFDAPITLGNCYQFIGFMENNKWGYDQWTLTDEQRAGLLERLQAICKDYRAGLADDLLAVSLEELFHYIQACKAPVAA